MREEGEEKSERRTSDDPCRNRSSNAELNREEVSPPPPSSSSTEASETVNAGGAGGGVVIRAKAAVGDSADIRDETAGNDRPSGRMKASAVLLQLISCVSGSVKPGESMPGREGGSQVVGGSGAGNPGSERGS